MNCTLKKKKVLSYRKKHDCGCVKEMWEKRHRRLLKINSTLNSNQLKVGFVTYLLEKIFDIARDYMLANELLNYWMRSSVKLRQKAQTEALRKKVIVSE